ncbi:pyridoxamine 5'-phosphate oxidase family protein [Neotabrizicola shimadae]|uniref:Pyridoxamine 5'-phosphate oxidase family protein n=1 Tax=Neotabrizicola shimadae TaxID=2807096 RepID=A0A8G0ZVQ2_9RHOB|nr:pyridoxamine 5'-phosphate oxidase family protein [Neotabrizicola shimadae]QYZ71012.1 pyridoxamine 5'-phosphate oxidase family protein [Neotabrizicola shimadae]
MGKQFEGLSEEHTAFIAQQPVFFVATVPLPGGHVNLSPKGMDSLRVVSSNRIVWLNLTGSGNETAPQLAADPRITLMWMSTTLKPMILRTYGTGRAVHRNDPDWPALAGLLPDQPGARQIVEVSIDLVQSSCGYAVPFLEFRAERPTLKSWAEGKGEDGIRSYWAERNATTLNGQPTGIEANL